MKDFKLTRIVQNNDGMFGVLIDNDIPFCLTVERTWKDNQEDISCIPAGDYKCKRVLSPRFGNTFEVANVPNRTHILFHKGNIDEDTKGCIILGEQYESLYGKIAVLSSGKAFKEFLQRTNDVNEFNLKIKEALE